MMVRVSVVRDKPRERAEPTGLCDGGLSVPLLFTVLRGNPLQLPSGSVCGNRCGRLRCE